MDLIIFLVVLIASQCTAYRGGCGSDDYYQDRHRGIRRHYQRSELSPEELLLHSTSLGAEEALDIEDSSATQESSESDEAPLVVLPTKTPRLSKIKYSKWMSHYLPKNLQNLGYKVIGKKAGRYGKLILLSPKANDHFMNKDDSIITVNGNEIGYPEMLSETEDYNLLNSGESHGVKELHRKGFITANNPSEYHAARSIQHRRNSLAGHSIGSVFKARRTLSRSRSHANEDILESDHSNSGPTVIVSARSDTDDELDNENQNTNVNTNANINHLAGTLVLPARRNALNAETEDEELSDIVSNDNDLSQTKRTGPTVIISARRKLEEAKNQNVNVNTNVNAESGSPTVVVGSRRNIQDVEEQMTTNDFDEIAEDQGTVTNGKLFQRQPDENDNLNKNVNVNTNVNANSEGSSNVIISARRSAHKAEARYGLRRTADDNGVIGAKQNNNNNINVNTNVNSENGESGPEIIIAGRRNAFKADARYGARSNAARSHELNSARRNNNKNVNVNTNVNADSEEGNPEAIVGSRRRTLKSEAGYTARKQSGNGDATGILGLRGELSTPDIFGRRNNNENTNSNANVNVNMNAEGIVSPSSLIGAARRRLSALSEENNLQRILGFHRPGRRAQHRAAKNENRNVNINVNRLEGDEA